MINRDINFSLWLDFIERDFLKNEFSTLVKEGVINGATSNPSIFANAITTSLAYKEQLETLQDLSPKEKYEALAVEDIKTTAQALRDAYDEGNDGYISIEVDPFLSNDTEATIEEGKRLFSAINEPNVMIKVPATDSGYKAMEELIGTGISVNATLIFSPEQARKCLDSMKKGLDTFDATGGERVEAVISVFVSRFDRLLDRDLEKEGLDVAKTGVYNAAKIYNLIEQNHTPSVRTLFASTGVKGDHLDPEYYIKELLAPHSVNTAPLSTIRAYHLKDIEEPKFPLDDSKIDSYFEQLKNKNFNMDEIYEQLLREGLKAFEEAFTDMLNKLK